MKQVTLRELCAQVGVSRRVIQRYEKAGLMKANGKNKYGYLLYDEAMQARAKNIRFFQKLGFKLNDIRDIIDMPGDVKKEALERQVKELKKEFDRLEQIMKEAVKYIESI